MHCEESETHFEKCKISLFDPKVNILRSILQIWIVKPTTGSLVYGASHVYTKI